MPHICRRCVFFGPLLAALVSVGVAVDAPAAPPELDPRLPAYERTSGEV